MRTWIPNICHKLFEIGIGASCVGSWESVTAWTLLFETLSNSIENDTHSKAVFAGSFSVIQALLVVLEFEEDGAGVRNEVNCGQRLLQPDHSVDKLIVVGRIDHVLRLLGKFIFLFKTQHFVDLILHKFHRLSHNTRHHQITSLVVPILWEPNALEFVGRKPLQSWKVVTFLHLSFKI